MTAREEMHRLTQEIIGSFEARTAAITSLRDEVAMQRRAAQGWVKDMASARQVEARQQRADLSKGHADLQDSVSAQLQELDRAHNAMARQQRADLSKGHAYVRDSVSAQLQELDRAHNATAQQQREGLAKAHVDLNRAEARRKAGFHSWMEVVATAHNAAREEWQNLAATMQAKRVGAVAVVEAPPEVAPAPSAIQEVAHAAAVERAAEKEEEAVEVGEVTEELASLSTRVFEWLANHPSGTRLTELEQELGMSRFQAARVVRHLMNEGRAEKRDLLYFAF